MVFADLCCILCFWGFGGLGQSVCRWREYSWTICCVYTEIKFIVTYYRVLLLPMGFLCESLWLLWVGV